MRLSKVRRSKTKSHARMRRRSFVIEQLEIRQLLANDLNIYVNDASDSFEGFDSLIRPKHICAHGQLEQSIYLAEGSHTSGQQCRRPERYH